VLWLFSCIPEKINNSPLVEEMRACVFLTPQTSHGLSDNLFTTTMAAVLWSCVSCTQDDPRVRVIEEWGRTSAKGPIKAFLELVMEDQGSWVALETEIEGALWGFTCCFWKPCFNLR